MRHRTISSVCLLVASLSMWDPTHATQFAGGTGTAADPYQIATAEQLISIGSDPNLLDKHFILIADIDLSGIRWSTAVIPRFAGTFDGNGLTISHLTIDGEDDLGLIGGFMYGGEIRDLGVVDVNITGSGEYIGALLAYGNSSVTRCYTTGVIRCGSWAERVGGLVGSNGGPVTQCYSACAVSGGDAIGGLIGRHGGTLTQCYSTGPIRGDMEIGGLVGSNDGAVAHCYSTSAVAGRWEHGGLVGHNEERGTVTQCYSAGAVSDYGGGLVGWNEGSIIASFWDVETSGQIYSDGGTGLTTAQMQSESTFGCWTGDGLWTIDDSRDYPRLWWEDTPGHTMTRVCFYGGGSGTQADPYLIYTAEDLNMVRVIECDWGKHFRLMEDIDLSGYSYNRALIGHGTPFSGVFAGNGHRISHLTIVGDGFDVGLFGQLAYGAEVRDLGVVDVNISGLLQLVGAMVGGNEGTLTHCYSTGLVNGFSSAGGLVGYNNGIVNQCHSDCSVDADDGAGGLVGSNGRGTVSRCYSTGEVRGRWSAGGLAASNTGTVARCYSTGAVSGSATVGGLIGGNNWDGIVLYSVWDVERSGLLESAAGVGLTTSEMMDPYVMGLNGFGGDPNWILDANRDYPRLAWEGKPGEMIPNPVFDWLEGNGTPEDPYRIETAEQLILLSSVPFLLDKHFLVTADIDLNPDLNDRHVFSQAVIADFDGSFDGGGHSISDLWIRGDKYVGLIGRLGPQAEVTDLRLADVNIVGSGYGVGGLAGKNGGRISKCCVTGTVYGFQCTGGLVGRNDGAVTWCHSTGNVNGDISVGGLVGQNSRETGTVVQCYSRSNVDGCCGVGGLVGFNAGSTAQSYSTGKVTGSIDVGGLLGELAYKFAPACFWDTWTSGQATSYGGTGLETAQMQTAQTFLDAGWDFIGETANGVDDIWWIDEGRDYPRLWWEADED
ncbi:MAG: hypothetical protein JW993_20260 [Sedimentisphaerales bacterium]|nr:hypothetical protein [Sedimentisphaerales bacterium]